MNISTFMYTGNYERFRTYINLILSYFRKYVVYLRDVTTSKSQKLILKYEAVSFQRHMS